MRRWLSFMAAVGLLPLAGQVGAECTDRVMAALDALETDVVGPMNSEQRAGARDILQSLCAQSKTVTQLETETVYRTRANEPEPVAAATADDDHDEEVSLLGMKIRRAGEDSKGRERLKKKR